MKQLFKILLVSVYLLPPCIAYSSECTTQYDNSNNPVGCISYDGCGYDTILGCQPCSLGYYNNNNSIGQTAACKSCNPNDGNYWPYNTNTTHMVFDPDGDIPERTSCPWKCDTGYYKSNDGTACVACPDGNTDVTDSESQQNISQCSCSDGKHLIYTTFTNSNNETMYKYFCGYCYDQNIDNSVSGLVSTSGGITTCNCGVINANDNYSSSSQMCACPNGATFGTDSCKCPADHYMQTVAGVSSCEHCPDHAHSPAGSDEKNDCQCTETGFETANYDTNNILESCTACSDGATYNTQALACECNANYYGDGQTCTRCPPGTTKPAGGYIITTSTGTVDASTSISDCHMSSATKFCTGSGNDKKCMQLIPSNATNINQSGS